MIRKACNILCLTVYSLFSLGISINIHYCKGHIIDLQINSAPEMCCSRAETCQPSGSSCCDDQSIDLENDIKQISAKIPYFHYVAPSTYSLELPPLDSGGDNPIISVEEEDPPPIPLWLKYKRLLFYS
ncbi:MAG: hypothetical protein KDC80_19335 [Saprospiraceae bacterium]|nr:hypothetical protein [Saprospiraceae bacterium]